jgi:hypothetical protein
MQTVKKGIWWNDTAYRLGYTTYFFAKRIVVVGSIFYLFKHIIGGGDDGDSHY